MEEVWKDIYFTDTDDREYDYRGLYMVSNMGRVKSVRTNNVLIGSTSGKGYRQFNLYKNGSSKQFKLHRLVAHMFVDNPDKKNKVCVNHINQNKLDNRACNLEWVTYMENNHHADRIQRINEIRKNNPHKRSEDAKRATGRKVVGVNQTTREVVRFHTIQEAVRFLGIKYDKYIIDCCKGRKDDYKGYKWFYEENYEK